jgi:hypothetical protein
MPATCSARLVSRDLIILSTFGEEQVVKLLIIQFPSTSYCFIPLGSKYLVERTKNKATCYAVFPSLCSLRFNKQLLVLNNPQCMFLPYSRAQVLLSYMTIGKIGFEVLKAVCVLGFGVV